MTLRTILAGASALVLLTMVANSADAASVGGAEFGPPAERTTGVATGAQRHNTPPAAGDAGTLHNLDRGGERFEAFGRTLAEIVGMEVKDIDGAHIGDVTEVVADAQGTVQGLVVETGGFLGIGARSVLLPAGDVQVDSDHFITAMTKAEVEALPDHPR